MIALDTILDAEPHQLDFEALMAEIEAENRDAGSGTDPDHRVCEVAAACHAMLGVNGNYKCGWLYTNTAWCPKRKRLIGSEQ